MTADMQRKLFPFILVMLEIVTFLSTDMYLPALPTIANDFAVSQDVAQYTLTLWFLGSMSMQLILGPLSEQYGRKNILIMGILVFIVSTLVCAFTDNMTYFMIARLFQGSTVCAVIVAGYATIHELYSGKEAVQILAIMSSITILAPALGPFLGAAIVSFWHWQYIFMLLAFTAILGLVGVYFYMPCNKAARLAQEKSNIKTIVNNYINIFTNKKFIKIALLNSLLIINFFIWIVESPFIIIQHYGKSELYFGLAQLFVFGGYICGAQTAKRLITKIKPVQLCNLGLTIVATSLSLMFILSYYELPIEIIIATMAGAAFGSSSMSGLYNRLAIESSKEPMSQRVAIYSLMVSLAASVGSWMVTLVNDMTFDNIAGLMLCCFVVAVVIYSCIKHDIELESHS